MNELVAQFQAGVDDYWRGELPEKWNDPAHRAQCAYCMGWYMESMLDLSLTTERSCYDA